MKLEAVTTVVTPTVEALGLEVDRLEVAAAGRRSVLRVFLDGDGPDGRGPSLDDIAEATRAISNALDESPAVGDAPYVLEVSSRGVSRPLTDPKHYRRNLGRLVEFALADGTSVVGRLQASDAAGVTLDVDGTERALSFDDVRRAVVQLELNRLPEAEAEAGDDEAEEE